MNKIKLIAILLVVVFITSTGCKKWLDINTDPNSPSEIDITKVLPGVMYDMGDDLSIAYSRLGYVAAVYTHQLSTREHYDQYGIVASSYANETYWNDLYAGPIKDLDVLIEKATDGDNMQYVGIAKVLKAYIFSQLIDLWGDIPFSEFNVKEIIQPIFDDDAAIYPQLITMITEGIADMENEGAENVLLPGADDMIYNGDIDKWVRLANTLKLKLYTQAQGTSVWDAAAVSNLLADDLIESDGDFMLFFGPNLNPDNRNPVFSDEWSGNQISLYISPWMFEIMNGINPDIMTGITDPRIPYYWCNQLAGGEPENPAEYRDGDFLTIYFGSTGVNRDHAGRSSFSMVGTYVSGGKYDDGAGAPDGTLDADDGSGDAPMRFISYADRLYLEAELIQAGLAAGNARDVFDAALNESFALVDKVVAGLSTDQTIPILSGETDVVNYIDNILTQYDAASADRQMELIMTQKWLQGYGRNVDSYTDYRRTGYPIMFDPNTNASDGGPDGNGDVPTQSSRDYVVSFPWPQVELDLNNNAPAQKNITTDKVFWDVN